METVQTRIPAYLWDSLQTIFYQHDYEFLRQVSFLTKVPVAELKRTILGSKGAPASIVVAKEDTWWENQKCPLRVRGTQGLWKQCPNFREAHGFCGDHKGWKAGRCPTVRHIQDSYFQTIKQRRPFQYEGDIVWVDSEGNAVDSEGNQIPNIKINIEAGIILSKDFTENDGS